MAEVKVSAQDRLPGATTAPAESPTPSFPDLPALHESIAGMFAAQGDWQRAYQHLRSAIDLSRDEGPLEEYEREVARLRRERAAAVEESLRDPLTTVYNRRYLDRRLDQLRAAGPMSLALVDLDLFKQVNDTFGHPVGDHVLRQVAALLQDALPPEAFCARYGGEEFALVLPSTGLGTALRIVERAWAGVAAHPWRRIRPGLRVTVSVGLAHCTPATPDGGLPEADRLLYAAKRAGRNTVAYPAYPDREYVRFIHHSR